MKKESITASLVFLCGAAALSCSDGGAVNIGDTQARGSQLSDYAASWDGYVEAYTFSPDNSDHVRLMIGANGQGSLQVGDVALLAPPTDPNVGYPPSNMGPDSPNAGLPMGLEGGFLYPLRAAQVQTNRVQLGVDPNDLFAAWCALETPVPRTSDALSYGCLPNLGFSYSAGVCALTEPDGTSVPVDCGKLTLCELAMVCNCTSTACTAASVPDGTPVNQYPIEIDAALDATGSTLTGTLALPGSTRVTVVLQKQ